MNKRFTKLIAALALLVFMTPSLAGWGQTKAEVVTYTLDGTKEGSGNAYAEYHSIKQNSVDWKVMGNVTTNPWRIGGKNLSEVDRDLYSENWFSDNITKVVVTNGTATATVNSMTLIVSTNSDFSNPTSTISGVWNASSTTTFERPAGADWTNMYFKLVYNITAASSSNQYAQFVKAEFYKESNGQQPTTYTVTFDAGDGTFVGNEDFPNESNEVTAGTYSLPNATRENYSLVWSDGTDTYEAGDDYEVTEDVDFTAQWTENTTPGGNSATLTQSNLGLTGSYTSNTEKTIDGITYVYTDLMKSNENIQAKASTGTIKNKTAYSGDITSVAITHSGTARATTINGSADGENWTQVATGSGSITADFSGKGYKYFQITRGSNAAYWEKIEIAWADGNAPSITANNVELAYDATSGNISYTINNAPTSAGTLTAAVANGEWLSLGTVDETVPFTCSVNEAATERTATVTLTYTYNRETVTKDVTITQAGNPNIVDNISDITATDTDYAVIGTIVAKSARGLVFGDGTGYVYYYNQNYTQSDYNVGDIKRISGTMGSYNHVYQFTSSAAIEAASSSNYNNTPAVQILDATGIAAYNNNLHLSDYVQIEGTLVKSGNYYNLQVEGLSTDASIAYPTSTQQTELDALESKTVIVKGYFAGVSSNHFNIVLESVEEVVSTDPSITLSDYEINATADATEGTIVATYANIPEGCEVYTALYESDGETTAEYDWITVTINSDNNVAYTIAANTGEARTAYFRVHVADEIGEVNVNSELVTVSQEAYVAPITSGKGTITFGKGNDVEIDNETVTGKDNLNNTWTITTVGTTSFTNNNGTGYSQVGSSNKPATSITFATTLPNEAVISGFEAKFGGFGSTAGTITLKVGEATVGTGSLNETNDVVVSSLPMVTGTVLTVTVTDIVRGVKCYYISYTLGAESYTLNITGYASDDTKDGYYLIASPVSVNPAAVAGMTEGDFDLYSYDDTEELEWRNYETSAFNLEPGKGYLYAKKATTETPNYEFTLTGAPYAGQPIQLIQGWNLIGNPYSTEATVSTESFYRMNPEGRAELIEGSGSVDAMEGIFVIAENDGDEVTFTPSTSSKSFEQVAINLFKNRGTVIDRAIVRFDEGQQLPKFQLNPENTKLYIAQGDKDYAIVRSAAQGEMPVSFRASENGTYTIAVEAENVDMNYLHLIDNMTGADVDLLATPNYTFEARTNDYTSRFRLVFSANGIDEQTAETFAFFNGTSWTVSNTGDATLQVVDITGRIVSSETINGNATVSLNQPAGIYMLRLVNGNDVKVQKVVVR